VIGTHEYLKREEDNRKRLRLALSIISGRKFKVYLNDEELTLLGFVQYPSDNLLKEKAEEIIYNALGFYD
jgi:hypothetical protein